MQLCPYKYYPGSTAARLIQVDHYGSVHLGSTIKCFSELKNDQYHQKRSKSTCHDGRTQCLHGHYTVSARGSSSVKTEVWGCGYSPRCAAQSCAELTAAMRNLPSGSLMTMEECRVRKFLDFTSR